MQSIYTVHLIKALLRNTQRRYSAKVSHQRGEHEVGGHVDADHGELAALRHLHVHQRQADGDPRSILQHLRATM